MRIARYLWNGDVRYGVLEGEDVYELVGDMFNQAGKGRHVCALDEVRLLAPVVPSKVVAIGLNYRAHAQESGQNPPEEPIIFLKPPTAVIGPEDNIVYPEMSKRVDHEAELAVVIGREARDVLPNEALDYVLGYTCGNDVTARDLQRKDGQWTRGKGFDTFCPLGPWITTNIDSTSLPISARVNGQTRQSSNTSHLIFPVPQLISFISRVMTLLPGDVIMTGTPDGIGPMQVGDVVEVEIGGIGVLRNRLVAPHDDS